jgi:deoxyadenosine/deoxycytidine kinase
MKIISIEGNIGSGKSTFVKYIRDTISSKRVCFLDEPVKEWDKIKDEEGKTVLENYYGNPKSFAFTFQMMAYISRLTYLKRAIESNEYDVIITERTLFTDKNVFCEMLYADGMINKIEYTIYNNWFQEFIDIIPPIQYVYLKTTPDVSDTRVKKRNRLGESTISLEYLTKCHDYHETWLNNTPNVTMIDANEKKVNIGWLNIVMSLV